MSTLQYMKIAGLRSYSPDIQHYQQINFLKPLTLIWGKNGSGKTTLLEALRFIICGSAPPNSNGGKFFITDPAIAHQEEVFGQVKLFFQVHDMPVLASKIAKLEIKNRGAIQYKSVEQRITIKDETGQKKSINHKCATIQRQIPQMLGIRKQIIEKIIFCHQEDALWPFSDNATLKNIFDQLFDTSNLVKVVENLSELCKNYKREVAELERKATDLKQFLDEKMRDRDMACQKAEEINQLMGQIRELESRPGMENITEKQLQLSSDFTLRDKLYKRARQIDAQLAHHHALQIDPQFVQLSLEQLSSKSTQQKHKVYRLRKTYNQAKQDKQAHFVWSQQSAAAYKKYWSVLSEIKKYPFAKNFTDIDHREEIVKKVLENMEELRMEKGMLQGWRDMLYGISKKKEIKHRYQQLLAEQKKYKEVGDTVFLSMTKLLKQVIPLLLGFQEMIANYVPNFTKPDLGLDLKDSTSLLQKQAKLQSSLSALQRQRHNINFSQVDLQQDLLQYVKKNKKCGYCSHSLDSASFEDKMEIKIGKAREEVNGLDRQIQTMQKEVSHYTPQCRKATVVKFLAELEDKKAQSQQMSTTQYTTITLTVQQFHQSMQQLTDITPIKNLNQLTSIPASTSQIPYLQDQTRQLKRLISYYKENSIRQKQTFKQRQFLEPQSLNEEENDESIKKKIQRVEKNGYEGLVILERHLREACQEIDRVDKMDRPDIVGVNVEGMEEDLKKAESEYARIQDAIRKKNLDIGNQQLRKESAKIERQLQLIAQQNLSVSEQYQLKYNLIYKRKQLTIQLNNLLQIALYQRLQEYSAVNAQKEVKELALKQIKNYIKTLERTMVLFHQQKIAQVNKVIYETWSKIYRGHDIKTFEIRSEEVEGNRKNYHYRLVVIHQSNIEMDMKGRCSLGQKVLASLVVRMALAESCGGHCGILALDEPTTNLDSQHIKTLAQQLNALIEYRKTASSFQLIIITHDDQLVKKLSHCAEFGYLVQRDKITGFSIIKQVGLQQ